jgi:ethanolamine ammonia-lyase small subunit
MSRHVIRDAWRHLVSLTPARIALGRTGASLPTREVLRFGLAHAQARDAVHTPFEADALAEEIEGLGFPALRVATLAGDRATYLRRPDYGRKLSPESRETLESARGDKVDLVLLVADGLSSTAIHAQAAKFLAAFKPWIERERWKTAPVVIAHQGRVALGDEIGEIFRARLAVVLIGERPGLSSPDSLGIYLTYGPKVGRSDAERNCISNIRDGGLSHELAAYKLAWLAREALIRNLTGVNLKDESDLLPPPAGRAALPGAG